MKRRPARWLPARPLSRIEGQSAAEFIIVAPTLLMLILGAIQFGLIYQAKATLNHAAFQVVRTGALNGGSQDAMKKELIIWLTPLFTYDSSPSGVQNAAAVAKSEVEYCRIIRVSPPDSVFADFGTPLPNDALMYRSTTPGGTSNMSVQDANLLKIKVVYCYKLIVPLVDTMIFSAINLANKSSTCSRPTPDKYIPIVSSAVIRMQSQLQGG